MVVIETIKKHWDFLPAPFYQKMAPCAHRPSDRLAMVTVSHSFPSPALCPWESIMPVISVKHVNNIQVRTCQHDSSLRFPSLLLPVGEMITKNEHAPWDSKTCFHLNKVTVGQTLFVVVVFYPSYFSKFKVNVWHRNVCYWLPCCCYLFTSRSYHWVNISWAPASHWQL